MTQKPGYRGPIYLYKYRFNRSSFGRHPDAENSERGYSSNGPAVTQRTAQTGWYPKKDKKGKWVMVKLTARESARACDIPDSVDIGDDKYGNETAQLFVGDGISYLTRRDVVGRDSMTS